MATKTKRIADFIDSIPESIIGSSTILLGGKSKKEEKSGTTNGGDCINGTTESCDRSTNRSNCRNAATTCNHAQNRGVCDNSYKRS